MHARPNVIYVYADDLGRGMLSCYGQQTIRTPNMDRIAAEGVRFERAYGCAVSAPARASLLTGYHDCHAGRWSFTRGHIYHELSTGARTYEEIRELINNTSYDERPDEVFLPHIARAGGLVAAQIGKLEWGFATTPERLARHGWDTHFGYYDHNRCHGFYPPFLFEDGRLVEIPGNTRADCGRTPTSESPEHREERWDRTGRAVYSQDLFDQRIEAFLRAHRDRPFFLYHPSQLPHGPIAVPEVHPAVRDAETLTDYEKEFASMVLRLDDTVGKIYQVLEEEGMLDRTWIVFASDNGHHPYQIQPGRCSGSAVDLAGRAFDTLDYPYRSHLAGDVFNGNDGFAGCKLHSLEGGARIPLLVRGPGVERPGTVCDRLVANYDFLPTLADLIGTDAPPWKDGLSYAPALTGASCAPAAEVVFAGQEGPGLVTDDGWKIRYVVPRRRFQLFHLAEDRNEERDLAAAHPDRVRALGTRLLQRCDGNFHNGTWEPNKAVRIDEVMDGRGPEEAFPVLVQNDPE